MHRSDAQVQSLGALCINTAKEEHVEDLSETTAEL